MIMVIKGEATATCYCAAIQLSCTASKCITIESVLHLSVQRLSIVR